MDPALNFYRTGRLLDLLSLAAFTMLGFGDMIHAKPYRLIADLLAADGVILFGLTAALLMEFILSLHITRAGLSRRRTHSGHTVIRTSGRESRHVMVA